MRSLLVVIALAITPIAVGGQRWTAPRTPWGDPDLQGYWPSVDMLGVPLERAPVEGIGQLDYPLAGSAPLAGAPATPGSVFASGRTSSASSHQSPGSKVSPSWAQGEATWSRP